MPRAERAGLSRQLASPLFADQGEIPMRRTCVGEDLAPIGRHRHVFKLLAPGRVPPDLHRPTQVRLEAPLSAPIR